MFRSYHDAALSRKQGTSGPLPLRGPLPLPGGGIGICNSNCLMPSGAKLPDPLSQSGMPRLGVSTAGP